MTRVLRSIGGLILAMAVLLYATDAASAAASTWTGTWSTSWTGGSNGTASMVLTQTGTTVTGNYDHKSGTIHGTVTGPTLAGTWTQSGDGGNFAFTLAADGKTWSGTWTGHPGGTWKGSCASGACAGNTAITSPSATKRPSATVVRCDRDVTVTTNAKYRCTAVVPDASSPPQALLPTGTVTWKAPIGAFSPATCTLVKPDTGSPSCFVNYEATNQDIPNQAGIPTLTASYSGDAVYAPSSGSPKLGPGGQASPDSVSPTSSGPSLSAANAAAIAAALAALGIGGAAVAGVRPSSLFGGPSTDMAPMLDALGLDGSMLANMLPSMSAIDMASMLQNLQDAYLGQHSISNPALIKALGGTGQDVLDKIRNMDPGQLKAVMQSLQDSFTNSTGLNVNLPPGNPVSLPAMLGASPNQITAALSNLSVDQMQAQLQSIKLAWDMTTATATTATTHAATSAAGHVASGGVSIGSHGGMTGMASGSLLDSLGLSQGAAQAMIQGLDPTQLNSLFQNLANAYSSATGQFVVPPTVVFK